MFLKKIFSKHMEAIDYCRYGGTYKANFNDCCNKPVYSSYLNSIEHTYCKEHATMQQIIQSNSNFLIYGIFNFWMGSIFRSEKESNTYHVSIMSGLNESLWEQHGYVKIAFDKDKKRNTMWFKSIHMVHLDYSDKDMKEDLAFRIKYGSEEIRRFKDIDLKIEIRDLNKDEIEPGSRQRNVDLKEFQSKEYKLCLNK